MPKQPRTQRVVLLNLIHNPVRDRYIFKNVVRINCAFSKQVVAVLEHEQTNPHEYPDQPWQLNIALYPRRAPSAWMPLDPPIGIANIPRESVVHIRSLDNVKERRDEEGLVNLVYPTCAGIVDDGFLEVRLSKRRNVVRCTVVHGSLKLTAMWDADIAQLQPEQGIWTDIVVPPSVDQPKRQPKRRT